MSNTVIFLVGLLAANLCLAFVILTFREMGSAARAANRTSRDQR